MSKTFLAVTLGIIGFEQTAWADPPAPPPDSQPQPPAASQPAPPAQPGAQPQQPAPPPGYPPPGYPPPQYPYPPYPYAPPPAPRTLPYQEGQPIPPGYRVQTNFRMGAVISGAVVMGVPYALGLSIAGDSNFSNQGGWLLIPGVGPWFTLAARKSCNSSTEVCTDDGVRAVLILDALMQTTGATLLIVGIAIPKTQLVRNDVAQVELVPVAGRGQVGLAAVGRF